LVETIIAYLGLFATAFLAATVLPLGSEAALVAMVYLQEQLVLPIVVATAGNYLGSCTTYWIGRYAARSLQQRTGREIGNTRAGRLLQRYGAPVMVLSWVPVIGDALVALAGSTAMPFLTFSVWVLLSKTLRYIAVAWTASAVLG
jgi:membrane protein YqaA with SNARE-associated domain